MLIDADIVQNASALEAAMGLQKRGHFGFAKDVLRDNDKALGLYEDCAAGNPSDPVVLNHIVGFFDSSTTGSMVNSSNRAW